MPPCGTSWSSAPNAGSVHDLATRDEARLAVRIGPDVHAYVADVVLVVRIRMTKPSQRSCHSYPVSECIVAQSEVCPNDDAGSRNPVLNCIDLNRTIQAPPPRSTPGLNIHRRRSGDDSSDETKK